MLHPDNGGHSPEMIDKADLESRRVTKNIVLDKDGKYHWYYEFKLLKNPTILFLLWKMFFWIGFGIWLVSVLLMTFEGNFSRLLEHHQNLRHRHRRPRSPRRPRLLPLCLDAGFQVLRPV